MQGCILWVPLDADYEVEITLSEKRPDLKKDVGFIVYQPGNVGKALWGYYLHNDALLENNLDKVFLCPNIFCDGEYSMCLEFMSQYQKASEPYLSYPSDSNVSSFYNVDISSFTNSFKKFFAKKDKKLIFLAQLKMLNSQDL